MLPREITASLATALRQVAANDEICQEVATAGGVHLALAILRAGAGWVGWLVGCSSAVLA